MKIGEFDADSDALKQRIKSNLKYGAYDLNDWVFNHMDLSEGLSILDLGCGTGNQTLPLAQMIGSKGHIIGIDISKESLDTLARSGEKLHVEKRIDLLHTDLDNIDKYLQGKSFDRILGCYSLYYVKDAEKLFETMHRVLKPEGILFFCGPAKNNNIELKKFHYDLLGEQVPDEGIASMFMEKTGQKLTYKYFNNVEIYAFQNPLKFDSEESLYNYWSSHNIYNKKIDNEFKVAAGKYFKDHSEFETVKRIVGVKARK
jgi:ubiquinone/menaquinone biosynthesis C-methylase UbiE